MIIYSHQPPRRVARAPSPAMWLGPTLRPTQGRPSRKKREKGASMYSRFVQARNGFRCGPPATQNYVYDSLNRIQQGYTNGSNWGQTFTVDPWGNLTNVDGVAGKTNPGALAAAPATTKNQLTGYTYDAAGNLSNDNLGHAFTYDAENRIVSTAGATTYVYDGDGQRVIKCAGTYPSCSSGTLYWTGVGSDTLSETALDGTSTEDYFYFNGLRVARVDRPSNVEHLYINDHLGTARMVVTPTGSNTVTYSDADYSPYGIEVPVSGSDPNRYKFTGKERDTESGLDMFEARYYGSTLGRYMTSDPAGKNAVNLANPQEWNSYAYVGNNPMNRTDPTGMFWEELWNFLRWSHWVKNSEVEAALQHDADEMRRQLAKEQLTHNGTSLTASYLSSLSNKEVYDLNASYQLARQAGIGVEVRRRGKIYTADIHHLLPQSNEFRKYFEDAGLDVDDYTMELTPDVHRLLPNGIHTGTGRGGDWNNTWREFFRDNPNASREQILNQMDKMIDEFHLDPSSPKEILDEGDLPVE